MIHPYCISGHHPRASSNGIYPIPYEPDVVQAGVPYRQQGYKYMCVCVCVCSPVQSTRHLSSWELERYELSCHGIAACTDTHTHTHTHGMSPVPLACPPPTLWRVCCARASVYVVCVWVMQTQICTAKAVRHTHLSTNLAPASTPCTFRPYNSSTLSGMDKCSNLASPSTVRALHSTRITRSTGHV